MWSLLSKWFGSSVDSGCSFYLGPMLLYLQLSLYAQPLPLVILFPRCFQLVFGDKMQSMYIISPGMQSWHGSQKVVLNYICFVDF